MSDKPITFTDGTEWPDPVVEIHEDLSSEQVGMKRAFWVPHVGADHMCAVFGYASGQGGPHKTTKAAAHEAWRYYPDAVIYDSRGRRVERPVTKEDPASCECDNTHQQNDTVCRYCWAKGRRHWNDPE